jgi:CHAT domain-containing protein/tetratricopeptide (TPR) repeat protein
MRVRWLGRIFAAVLLAAPLAGMLATGALAQGAKDFSELNRKVELLHRIGKYNEAAPIAEKVLALSKASLGEQHPDTLAAMTNLAQLYMGQGRLAEAGALLSRAITALERVRGKEHLETLTAVKLLAEVYTDERRFAEAEPLFRRAQAGATRVLGPEAPFTLGCIDGLAALSRLQGRMAEAEELYTSGLKTAERVLGPDHPDTIANVNNLGVLYRLQGRYAEAEPLYRRAVAASERVRGKDHPDTLKSLNNLAGLYNAQGRFAEAEPLYLRALESRERVLGGQHPDTLFSAATLGELYFKQRDWTRAAQLWRRSTRGIAARTRHGAGGAGASGKKASEAEQLSWQFSSLARAVYHQKEEGTSPNAAADMREMFHTAQWALSSQAAEMLAQMAARTAKGSGAMAGLVRERQDLLAEWQQRDAWRNAALGQETQERDAKEEAQNLARLDAINARITEIDRRLAVEFPDYAEFANPVPVTVEDIQAQLHPDEALVLILYAREWKPTPEETFLWVVTKTEARWERAEMRGADLAQEVQALRCGLDAAAWTGSECRKLLGEDYTGADAEQGKPLPFNLTRAHALYTALFGRFTDMIEHKQLIIVPSGPLTQLPFQVLPSALPSDGGFRKSGWLIRDHALTVLPAASSLKALRRVARSSAAAMPMIGFGNPLLDGPGGRNSEGAQLARGNQQCGAGEPLRIAAVRGLRSLKPVETKSGLADVATIRYQYPLPETADELCAVARDLKAETAEIRLGSRATEQEIKALSSSGRLAQYRIVHFATHGALAGQLSAASEPGLILTPPEKASEEDDGYLTASEIAGLKLDADWVILSACNTAGGDASGGQALSGLARAFFYAQARALLVSHWEVNSNAAVKLITSAAGTMARQASVGRSEALRRAMLALIVEGDEAETHPSYWAPFVVVGEGAR